MTGAAGSSTNSRTWATFEAAEGKGFKIRDGRNIEFYSTGRYIAVTGVRLAL